MNQDDLYNEKTRIFKEFLQDDFGTSVYSAKIDKMIDQDQKRLLVNVNHLRDYNREYCDGLLTDPMEYLPPFEKALNEICALKTTKTGFYIGLFGSFGENNVSPRNLSSAHLGKMLCLEAIVTRCSLVRPKVYKSVHYCEATKLFSTRDYRDGLSIQNDVPTSSVYPKEDENGNPLQMEFGYSTYKDFQMIYVQEMPERSPAGQLPRPIDVILEDDLVDKVKPGDRIMVVGTFRTRGKNAASMSAIFNTVFIANNISLLNKQIKEPTLDERDIREIKKIAKRTDCFDLLSKSLAPSLYGHEYIKKSLLLLMMGGVEKNLENGTHLRGDINILLIGDPSVGKSQMLRFVLNLAPLAIATTGRGSSGVGLTAAVTQDKETGERSLEAGAMVLADRGVVCIDEFDKMSDVDRVAIHEVMEQQTVTIAKAGIHTSLNARCSVLAAANPAFGSYLDEKKPFENITMPDSLLSRFDLVFVVLDKTDDEFNRKISDHITRLHRYTPPGVQEGVPLTEEIMISLKKPEELEEDEETPVFEAFNELLHIGIRPSRRKKKQQIDVLSIPFLKKYLYYCKNRIQPVLTPEASDSISKFYSELRAKVDGEQDQYRTMPITPRTLETLIRLSTAHAKTRLSKHVEEIDVEVAYEILVFALFKEVKSKKRGKKQRVEEDSDDSDSDQTVAPSFIRSTRSEVSRPSRVTGVSKVTSGAFGAMGGKLDDDSMVVDEPSTVATTAEPSRQGTPTPGDVLKTMPLARFFSLIRFDLFRARLNAILQKYTQERGETPSVTLDEIMEMINVTVASSEQFSKPEVVNQLQIMSEDNMSLWWQPESEQVLFY